jgi:rod shape-determining protein MreB
MQKLELAIELGSSNVVIYKKGNGIILKEPTLISYKTDGKKVVVKSVGHSAKKQLGKTSISVNFVNPIENGQIKDVKMASLLLKKLLGKVIESKMFNPKISILFVTSCALDIEQKTHFKNVGYDVGASEVKFVPSVIASLIGSGVDASSSNTTLSVNLGGGTVDIASVGLNSILEGFTETIGGENIDESIRLFLSENSEYNLLVSRATAEKIKLEIASLYIHDTANIEVSGIDVNDKTPTTTVVTSKAIYPCIEYFFKKVVGHINHIINISNPDVVTSIAENGIYISGGLANITGLKHFIENKTNIDAVIVDQPENCAIIGAGKLLSDKKTLASIIKEN